MAEGQGAHRPAAWQGQWQQQGTEEGPLKHSNEIVPNSRVSSKRFFVKI
jgi:hypothetical protein